MRSVLQYLKKYKLECVLAPLFKLLEACFDLLVPFVVKAIMDIGIKNRDTSYIIHGCVILVALGIIGLSCSLVAQFFAAKGGNYSGNGGFTHSRGAVEYKVGDISRFDYTAKHLSFAQ